MRRLQEMANITTTEGAYNYGKYYISPRVFWDKEVLYVIFDKNLVIRGIKSSFDDAKFTCICLNNFK